MVLIGLAMVMGIALMGLIPDFDFDYDGTDASENYSGTDGDDQFNGRGGNDLINGNGGDDSLEGAQGADWLIGLLGDDTLSGGDGSDVLIGGAGSDMLNAGAGDDFVEAANVIDNSALENSLETAGSFHDIDVSYDLPKASDEGDHIELGDGDDTAVIGSDDTLGAGAGEDEIHLGDWIAEGRPATIDRFDARDDLLVFTYDAEGNAPKLTLRENTETGATELCADGKVVAELINPLRDVTLDQVRITTYS